MLRRWSETLPPHGEALPRLSPLNASSSPHNGLSRAGRSSYHAPPGRGLLRPPAVTCEEDGEGNVSSTAVSSQANTCEQLRKA